MWYAIFYGIFDQRSGPRHFCIIIFKKNKIVQENMYKILLQYLAWRSRSKFLFKYCIQICMSNAIL